MASYQERLTDPRWQRKRLEILERDKFMCQICFDSESTLHVHHRKYLPNKDPWDIPDLLLITLCEDCHKEEKEKMYEYMYKMLVPTLKEKFLSDNIFSLFTGFYNIKIQHAPEVTASIIEWALQNKTIMEYLDIEYFKMLGKKYEKQP